MTDYNINDAKNDIQNLQEQNSYDFQEIKRLDNLIKEYDKRILGAINFNNQINKKIQDEYEEFKQIVIDENVSATLDKKIDDKYNSNKSKIEEMEDTINELFTLIKNNGSESDSSGLGDEYETSCTSEYILDKMYPMGQSHEAIPSGLITDTWKYNSRWENQTRPTAEAHSCGQNGCPGTGLFKALGCWASVYRVEGTPFTQNTGVEMKDIKVYGWYDGAWELVQHLPVPKGNFYAESFGGDASKYFADSIKETSTYKTIILREANKIDVMNWNTGEVQTENCMYHPFSDVKYFDTKYEYIYACIDLRKVKWDANGIDDRDSSHYCSNCGADWWLAEGLTFHDSWQHNKGVCQPKMIEITNEWRRFSMTTVPEYWQYGFPKIEDNLDFGTGSDGGSGLTATQLSNIAKIPNIQSTVDALPNNYASKKHSHSEYASSSHKHDASEIDNLPSGGGSGEGLTSTQKQQLQTAYNHSQSPHVNSEELSNITSTLKEFILDEISKVDQQLDFTSTYMYSSGFKINYENGKIEENSKNYATLILVPCPSEPFKLLGKNSWKSIAFYDSNEKFINGYQTGANSDALIINNIPDNSAFIKFSVNVASVEGCDDNEIKGYTLKDKFLFSTSGSTSGSTSDIEEFEEDLRYPGVEEYCESKHNEVMLKQGDNLTFAFFTDLHYQSNGVTSSHGDGLKHIKNVAELSKTLNLDFIAFGGDILQGTDKNTMIGDFKKVIEVCKNNIEVPFFFTKGNHDENTEYDEANGNTTSEIVTHEEWYNLMVRPSFKYDIKMNPNDRTMGYFYKDFDNYKLRIIMLNTLDRDFLTNNGLAKYKYSLQYGVSQKQLTWLSDVALNFSDKSDSTDWGVIVFTHIPLKGNTWGTVNNGECVIELLNKFKNGGVVNYKNTHVDFGAAINKTFEGTHNTVVVIQGHTHRDSIEWDGEEGDGIPYIQSNCSSGTGRVENSVNNDSFDIFIIDKKNKKIIIEKFGTGVNRVYNY